MLKMFEMFEMFEMLKRSGSPKQLARDSKCCSETEAASSEPKVRNTEQMARDSKPV